MHKYKKNVKDEGTYNEYKRLKELAEMMGDRGSCGPIALAAATGIKYQEAFNIYAEEGRKKGHGVYDHQIVNATKRSGFYPCQHSPRYLMGDYKYANTMTFNNAAKVLDKDKTYMLVGSSHVATLRNGRVIDWTQGRKLQVQWVIELQDENCTSEKDKGAREKFFQKLNYKKRIRNVREN